jgi:hypothetical protein
VPFGNLEMTAADVVDSVTKSIHEKEELGEHTWCIQRLLEKEIKRGEGAHVSLRGNQRHMATQLTTGAMSKAGLQTITGDVGGKKATVRTRATTLLRTNKNKNETSCGA